MNKTQIDEFLARIEMAREKISELKKTRQEYTEALRQLDLNEAGWLGYIEALRPYSEMIPEEETTRVIEH